MGADRFLDDVHARGIGKAEVEQQQIHVVGGKHPAGGRGGVGLQHVEAFAQEPLAQRATRQLLVVHDENGPPARAPLSHGSPAGGPGGSAATNRAPPRGAFSQVGEPPCASTVFGQIARPSPVPSARVLKTSSTWEDGAPGPVSSTTLASAPPSRRSADRTVSPWLFIACAALRIRFARTSTICPRSIG